MYAGFEDADTVVIAVAQEDKDLESHGKFLQRFESLPPFEIVADLGRADTDQYKRTCTYFIDRQGVVRQIFPQTIHYRVDWSAILAEVQRMTRDSDSAKTTQATTRPTRIRD